MKTKRQRIVDAVVARMKSIRVANGYQTDAGLLAEPWAVRFDERELADAPAKCGLGVCDLQDDVSKESRDSRGATHRMRVQVRIFKSGAMTLDGLRIVMGDVVSAVGRDVRWKGLDSGGEPTGNNLAIDTEPGAEGFVVPTEALEVAAAAVEFVVVYATRVFDPYE